MYVKRYVRLMVLLLACMVCLRCAFHLDVAEVHARADRIGDRTVVVSGRVVETLAIPLLGRGMYRLEDGTGGIWVMTSRRVPFRGDKVTVKGKVKTGVKAGGRVYGVVLVEQVD